MALMRFRIIECGEDVQKDAKPVVTAADRQTAETCAISLSADRPQTFVVIDFTNHEDPEVESYWRGGRKLMEARS